MFLSRRRCDLSDFTNVEGGTVIESLMDREIYIVPYVTMDLNDMPGRKPAQRVFRYMENMKRIYDQDTLPQWVRTWKKEVRASIYLYFHSFHLLFNLF